MEKHASNNPDFNTMMKETKRDCEGNSDAWSYGQSESLISYTAMGVQYLTITLLTIAVYDLTLMDKWSMPFAAESIVGFIAVPI